MATKMVGTFRCKTFIFFVLCMSYLEFISMHNSSMCGAKVVATLETLGMRGQYWASSWYEYNQLSHVFFDTSELNIIETKCYWKNIRSFCYWMVWKQIPYNILSFGRRKFTFGWKCDGLKLKWFQPRQLWVWCWALFRGTLHAFGVRIHKRKYGRGKSITMNTSIKCGYVWLWRECAPNQRSHMTSEKIDVRY